MSSAAPATIALKPGVGQVSGDIEVIEPEGRSALAPFLDTRVKEIVADHHSANKAASQALIYAARCGRSLLALKDDLEHGAFIPFMEEHLPFTRQTATGYMRIAKAVDAGELEMENVPSIRSALKQLAAPKVEKVPCPTCGQQVRPEHFKRGLPDETARRRRVCPTCATKVEERFWAPPKPYVVDTDRKRDLANKAEERFWAVTTHITSLEEVCAQKGAPLGEILHLDRVIAVADRDHLREQVGALDQGIRRAKELRRELAELLEAC